jgi:energy-coupling factor transporter transmembrane protein EcfT
MTATALDARTKLLLLAAALVAILATQRPPTSAIECLVTAGLVFAPRGGGPRGHRLRLLAPTVVLVFGVGIVFYDLATALLLAARIFNLLAVSVIFFRTVGADEMAGALRKLGVPFTYAFTLSTAMRYVPLIGRKIRTIIDAQQARGIDLRPRLKNVANFTALLAPLVVQAFVLSDQLALAMESRGFGCRNRSSRRRFRLSVVDVLVMAAGSVGAGLLVWWENG